MATPNKDRLRMWVRALKSGQYQQGRGYMKTEDNKYCCLGVAMDIAFANGVTTPGHVNWGKTASMPDAVSDFYGLEKGLGGNAKLKSPEEAYGTAAASLNDFLVPFNDIADRIVYTFRLDQED